MNRLNCAATFLRKSKGLIKIVALEWIDMATDVVADILDAAAKNIDEDQLSALIGKHEDKQQAMKAVFNAFEANAKEVETEFQKANKVDEEVSKPE